MSDTVDATFSPASAQSVPRTRTLRVSVALLRPPAAQLDMTFHLSKTSIAQQCRLLSGFSNQLKIDPSKLVHGLTREALDGSPALQAYVLANFPQAFEGSSNDEPKMGNALMEEHTNVVRKKQERVEYPRNIRSLHAYRRDPVEDEGSRRSRELRQVGMIPGILYGSDPNLGIYSFQPESKVLVKTPWRLILGELDRYHHHFESRVYDLTLYESPDDQEGAQHRVLPRNMQRHPVKTSIYCVNFCRYHPGRPIKLPVFYINEEESPALKRDGFILPIQRYIECFVEDGVPIPDRLDLECSGLFFKDVIRLDRIILPEGVRVSDRVLKRDDFIVGVVAGSGRGANMGEDNETPTGS